MLDENFWNSNFSLFSLYENIEKLLFLNFFSHLPKKKHPSHDTFRFEHDSRCNLQIAVVAKRCETPFQWNLAYFILFYMLQAFLACRNSISLALFF